MTPNQQPTPGPVVGPHPSNASSTTKTKRHHGQNAHDTVHRSSFATMLEVV